MLLDARTLIVVVTTISFFLSVLSLSLWRLHRHIPGLMVWAIGFAFLFLGSLLIFLRGFVSSFLSVFGGNLGILGGFCILMAGLHIFAGRRPPHLVLFLLVSFIAVCFLATYDDPELFQIRNFLFSSTFSVISFLTAWGLRRPSKATGATTPRSGGILRVLFFLNGLACLAWFIGEMSVLDGHPRTLWNSHLTTWYYYWSTIFIFGLAAGLPFAVTEYLRNEMRAQTLDLDAARRVAETSLRDHRNFLSMLSHEFRTPLGFVDASSEVIACNLSAEDLESHDEVKRIRRATKRMFNLVDACITDEWLSAASRSPTLAPVALRSTLEELAAEYTIPLEWRPEEEITVSADPYLLSIAFSSLIDNAVKYGKTRDGVRLSVSLETHQEPDGKVNRREVIVDVSDNGPGIPPNETEQIFDKYYRASSGRRKPGTGLGLYLTREIITRHGGAVTPLPTTAQGAGGCTMRVRLPMEPTATSLSRQASDNRSVGEGART